jgi:hypothetical protein
MATRNNIKILLPTGTARTSGFGGGGGNWPKTDIPVRTKTINIIRVRVFIVRKSIKKFYSPKDINCLIEKVNQNLNSISLDFINEIELAFKKV